MASSARVTSVQAITDFKAALLAFCQEAKEVLASIDMENRRMTDWVERDRLGYWQREIRNRQEELAQAKADLFRKQITRISGQHPDFIEERDALRLATYRLEEAEDKVQLCRRWGTRQLPRAIDEFQGPGRQLAALVEGNPPQIVQFLDRVIRSLEAYLDLGAPSGRDNSAASSEAPANKEEAAASEGVTVIKQEPS
jgi:hypothetical protein